MANEIDEMLSKYKLGNETSILPLLDDFKEEEIREYCWRVLRTYPDLKKEDWFIGMEGGDYIYSFEGNYIFITDDIWSFNLIASQPVQELLVEKMSALKISDHT
jgi:hypothetical protein